MQTKQNTLWTVVLAIASGFTGCVYDHDERSLRPEGSSMIIKFTLPAGETLTRSVPAETGENNINDLTLLFFDYTTNGTGAFVNYYQVPPGDIPAEDEMYGDLNNLFDLEVIFQSNLGLTLSNAYSILAFANLSDGNYFNDIYDVGEFDRFIRDISLMNQNQVRTTMVMQVSGVGGTIEAQDDDSKLLPRSNLPMSASATKEANSANVDCQLIRAVVRYDVINRAANYTLVSASIWNAFPRGYVFDNVNVDYSYNRLKRYYGLKYPQGMGEIKGGLYSFENVNTNPTQKDEKTTCLILGLINDSAPAEGASYYRVNVSPKVTGQYLTRNNVYQITISAVNGIGAPSEPDAYNSEKVLIDTSINSWDRDEDGLIVRDETHMMAIPTKRTYFGPQAAEGNYFIYTMGEGTLTMTPLAMPEGMTATLVGNDLRVTVTDFSGDKRTAAVRFNFAGLTAVMEIIQSGQANKNLKLSHTQVGSWPASPAWMDRIAENPVLIESSGPWTAEIYNDGFSFVNGSVQSLLNGVNGGKIENVYSTSVNTDPEMQHSFILVTLDDDPENYRNVIVLTQLGSGSFTITPDAPLTFNADGVPTSSTNTYQVYPGADTDTWKAELSGTNADAFSIEIHGTIEDGQVRGRGSFTITAAGDNYDTALSALVTVTHNNLNEKYINISQEAHTFSLSHTAFSMDWKGGETVLVSVLCSETGNTWSAEIDDNIPDGLTYMKPYIVNSNQERVTTLSNQPMNATFRVWMPALMTKLDQLPKAVVKVTLDGVEKEATLTVTQSELNYTPIYAHTFRPGYYGNWNGSGYYYNLFGQWANVMRDGANFGPQGTVYSSSSIDVTSSTGFTPTSIKPIGGVMPRIFNLNSTIHSAAGDAIKQVRNDPNSVYVVSQWETLNSGAFLSLGVSSSYTVAGLLSISRSIPRRLNTDENVRRTELWKYIFQEGPFGQVTVGNVALHPQDFTDQMYYLTNWPNTFIPLMYAPDASGQPNTGRALVGVDPTNRIIWIGHKDMFGIDNTSESYIPNWIYTDNMIFLQNLIAWMVNVNNYGDVFNDRFKQTLPLP